jgi:hypothetical protein
MPSTISTIAFLGIGRRVIISSSRRRSNGSDLTSAAVSRRPHMHAVLVASLRVDRIAALRSGELSDRSGNLVGCGTRGG